MAIGREAVSEKKKEQQPQKKANDVWKNDASGYWPVSIPLYWEWEAQLEGAGERHACWVMKPRYTNEVLL